LFFVKRRKFIKKNAFFSEMASDVVALDAKDRKLLIALDFDARAPVSSIARSMRLSKQNVNYRIKAMQRKKVISGFYPVIGIMRLGFFYCRFFLKLHNLTRQKEAELFRDVVAESHAKWVLKSEGGYDLVVAAWFPTLHEMKSYSESLSERYGQFIKEKKESIGIRIAHFQSRFLSGVAHTKELVVSEMQPVAVDDKDKHILKELVKDARKPLVEIARAIGLTAKQVAYRIRKMEQEQVILGYRPNINHNLLGFTHYKLFFYVTNVTAQDIKKFKAYLGQLPEVLYIVDQIGLGDVDVEIMLPSSQSLFAFINRVKFAFPSLIKEYELIIIEKTLKINYLPF
jgi:Lrp/AsnC family transcriptional regulator, regulator for asnA, asnC and gidA